jgi:Trypsin-co-occurring domain 2
LIELAEVTAQLDLEHDHARTAAEGDNVRLELGPIELELTVGLEAAGAQAKEHLRVVELGCDARETSTSTQKIKLLLNPTGARASSGVGDRRGPAYVHGGEAAGAR